MQKIEVLIAENAFGSVRPVEVAATVPLSMLVPALIEELKLPQTDLLGRKIVYMLCDAPGGHVLPAETSLMACGILPGATLALDSYVIESPLQASMRNGWSYADPAFHSSATLAEQDAFPALGGKTTTALLPGSKKERRWTRRGFLVLGGAVLGAGGAGLGYAAYRSLMNGVPLLPFSVTNRKAVRRAATHATSTAKHSLPTMARAILSFTQHQQHVRAVAWSPDGKMLASGADDAQLMMWDTSGTLIRSMQHPGSVRAAAWSLDGQQLVSGAANQVTFLNPLTGGILARSSHRHTAAITSLAWSQGTPSRVVSGALDKRAIVWNATTYHPETIFTLHTNPIESVSWAADGQTVGTSSLGGVVRVWNASSGQEVHGFFSDAQVPLRALAFAPSGMQLAVGGDDGVVRMWDGLVCLQQRPSGPGFQCLDVPRRLNAHMKAIRAVAWSPDAQLLATGGDDGVLAIWLPAEKGSPLLQVHSGAPLRALSWSPNGRQIAAASGNVVTIWELS